MGVGRVVPLRTGEVIRSAQARLCQSLQLHLCTATGFQGIYFVRMNW